MSPRINRVLPSIIAIIIIIIVIIILIIIIARESLLLFIMYQPYRLEDALDVELAILSIRRLQRSESLCGQAGTPYKDGQDDTAVVCRSYSNMMYVEDAAHH